MVLLRLSPWVGPETVFWTSMSVWCSTYVYLVFVASSSSSSSLSSSKKETRTEDTGKKDDERNRWNSFATCPIPHDVHSVVTVVLATLSLWNVLDEYFPTQFSMAYFVLDLADCLARRRWIFVVHAGLTLGLMSLCFVYPLLYQSKLISCGLLTEFSTPFLHYWNTTRSKLDFWYFVAAFTLCRILWIPLMWKRGSTAMGFYDSDSSYWQPTHGGGVPLMLDKLAVPIVTFLFYSLQVAWWCKMLGMLWDYKEPVGKRIIAKVGKRGAATAPSWRHAGGGGAGSTGVDEEANAVGQDKNTTRRRSTSPTNPMRADLPTSTNS